MKTTVELPWGMCLISEFPETKQECPLTNNLNSSTEEIVCFICSKPGEYFCGGSLLYPSVLSRFVCMLLLLLILVFGTFGIIANVIIIKIIRRHGNLRAFDFMLKALAFCDLLSCLTAMVSAVALELLFGNFSVISLKNINTNQ